MSCADKSSIAVHSKRALQVFQCHRSTRDCAWNLPIANGVVEASVDCEVTYLRQFPMTTSESKPKKGAIKPKPLSDKIADAVEESTRPWNGYCRVDANGVSTALDISDTGIAADTVDDIDKWLKVRTESISGIDMDIIKSGDDDVGQYLGDELQHSFLEKDTHNLSIDIDLSDKKLNLGFDPILEELQSEKFLETCEKDGFILPEFQLDQLDPLSLTPNDMMVAGEILPSTSMQPNLSCIQEPNGYSSEIDNGGNKVLNPVEEICDKSTQVDIYDLDENLVGSSMEASKMAEQGEIMQQFDPEVNAIFDNIHTDSSVINCEPQISSIKPNITITPKIQPSIIKKRQKVPEINNSTQGDEECQTERSDGVMAVVAISTDKRSNMTQIVINTEQGEQIYQGKTSELMEATGYFSKPHTMNTSTAWNKIIDTDSGSNNNHEIIISSALEELGYTDDTLMSVALPNYGNAWVCPREDCNRGFNRLFALKNHLLTHFGVRPFKCDYEGCTWGFYSDFKLKRHKETHLKRKNYVCSVAGCEKRFTTVYNLWSHEKLHSRPNRIACPVPECNEKYPTKRALELHMKTHDESHATYICTHEGCDKRYFSSNALTSHQRCHNYKDVDVTCSWPNCGKIFDKPCRLKAHLRSHTGTKPYLCTFPGCKSAFTSSSKLKRHEKKHTNDRKFICDVEGCSKAFMRSEHLKEHKLTHSEGRYFLCHICNARFSAKSSLYVHIKKHQLGKLDTDTSNVESLEPQYNCIEIHNVDDFCNDLPIEMVSELPDDPLSLETAEIPAGSMFINKKSVVTKPRFVCTEETCTRSYLTKSSLKAHMIKAHSQPPPEVTSPIITPELDYEFLKSGNNCLETSIQVSDLESEDRAILRAIPQTSCLPEPEPPPLVSCNMKNIQPRVSVEYNRIRKNHGSARTGLTCSEVLKLKSKNLMTLNSIVSPSDVDLGTTDLGEGLLLTEELPSMYYQDDIVGTECQILLLDSAAPESSINLRDLE